MIKKRQLGIVAKLKQYDGEIKIKDFCAKYPEYNRASVEAILSLYKRKGILTKTKDGYILT